MTNKVITKYSKDHEWIKIEGDTATIGITAHAAEALGELVYVELPEVNAKCKKGDAIIVVESSKSASDVYSPMSGEIIAINESLTDAPNKVNDSPLKDGWIAKIKFSNIKEIENLMDEKAYNKHIEE